MTAPARIDRVNILLVDDQPAKLLTYQTILGDLGDTLVTASSAAEALRLQRPRHLVLRAGRVVAATEPARSVVHWHGEPQEVDFRPV